MGNPIESVLSDPWGMLESALDGPLHPGGREATAALLDRADVTAGTRVLDVGCGAGDALAVARERGADAVGVDRQPSAARTVRGEMTELPVQDGSVEVVLSECVLCLADDLDRALAETHRVLAPDGRLALSDVVVDGEPPELPAEIATALCLSGPRDPDYLRERVAAAGYAIQGVRDHREDILSMRERMTGNVDYGGLLAAMGEQGQRILDGIDDLETAVEDGRVSYVSLVANREP